MYIHRTLENFFNKASQQFPVLFLTGARQVGKTTFLQHLCGKERRYVTLDDPMLVSLAKEDPGLFLQRFVPPVLIDEIQYAPELLPYIKMIVDRERKPGMFWLTGSQQFHLMKGVSESLAGRVGVINMLGLSNWEITRQGIDNDAFLPTREFLNINAGHMVSGNLRELYLKIWRGSFPAIALNKEMDKNLFYSSYVQTYLQRDIRDLAKVGDEMAFLRFLRTAAARTGQLLNMTDMSQDANVSINTTKNWLSILQASGIIYLLEPFYTNLSKRLIKTPKLYFLDTGLASYLTEWTSPETLEAGAMSGAILETWIFSEILKSYWHNGQTAQFYYYRDKDKKEIDLLIVRDGTIFPVEFKKSSSPNRNDVRNFSLLDKLNMPVGQGGVICLTDSAIPLTEKAEAIPIWGL